MSRNSSRFFTAFGVTVGAAVTVLVARALPRLTRHLAMLAATDRTHGASGPTRARSVARAPVLRRAGDFDPEDTAHLRHALAGGEGKSARRVSAARSEERARRLVAPSLSPRAGAARSTS